MFRKFGSRIAAALGLASASEKQSIIDKLQTAVDATPKGQVAVDLETGGMQSLTLPEHMQARRPRHRMRDRNTKFSRRIPPGLSHEFAGVYTPRDLHAAANNRTLHFVGNPLLTGLLYRSGAMSATHPKLEVTQ